MSFILLLIIIMLATIVSILGVDRHRTKQSVPYSNMVRVRTLEGDGYHEEMDIRHDKCLIMTENGCLFQDELEGDRTLVLPHHRHANCVCLLDQYVCIGWGDSTKEFAGFSIYTFDFELVHQEEGGSPSRLCAQQNHLVVAHSDRLEIWKDGHRTHVQAYEKLADDLRLHTNHHLILVADRKNVHVFRFMENQIKHKYTYRGESVSGIGATPNGTHLFITFKDRTIKHLVRSVSTLGYVELETLKDMTVETGSRFGFCVTSDGKYVAFSSPSDQGMSGLTIYTIDHQSGRLTKPQAIVQKDPGLGLFMFWNHGDLNCVDQSGRMYIYQNAIDNE